MENYKSLESYRFFVSGWVQTVEHFQPTASHYVFRAAVKPSYRVTEEPHYPWVAATKEGKVIAGHCNCMAGLGETCSHVGALLFKIEAAVRLGYTRSTCTDVPCAWNQCFVKDVQPAKIKDMKFYTEASRVKIQKTERRKAFEPATENEQQQFLNALASTGKQIVGLSAFGQHARRFVPKKPPPPKKQLPNSMRSLYNSTKNLSTQNLLDEHCNDIASKLSVSCSEAEYLAQVTIAQTSSMHWHEQRAGRITASIAHDYLHTNVTNPSRSLLKRTCSVKSAPLRVPAVLWGKNNEENAFRLYEHVFCRTSLSDGIKRPDVIYATSEDTHHSATVVKSGLVVSPALPHLGASPDGIINCECHGKGVLEIKCPYSHRESGVKVATSDRAFCLDDRLCLKPNHAYYTQVQFQMLVCGGSYADFVVWTLNDCVIHRVLRNEPFIEEMKKKHLEIWTNFILPEVVTRRLENEKENHPVQTRAPVDGPRYCLCRSQSVDDTMVGCDRCDDWFHLRCLKLKRTPRSKNWYCPACRKASK